MAPPGCEIHNHYGPTETTVGVLTFRADGQVPNTASGTLPLGKPLGDARVYILDENGQPVPTGTPGELYIGGTGVARGYLNRPELTRQKFVRDLFSDNPADRMYRSGDIARQLPDGNIEFLGRVDDQVKIHGNRVELGEVEAELRAHPGVRESAVLACEDASGDKQLIGYLVPKRADQPLWTHRSVCVLPDGAPVAHLNKNETDYIYNEIFVLQAYLRHGITIDDGDCILDAGSNIGLFTLLVNRLARNVRTYSFEPNPAVFACLKANTETWCPAAKCFPFGLSRENRFAEMTFFHGLSLLSGIYADPQRERGVVESYVANTAADLHSPQFAAEVGELIDRKIKSTKQAIELRTLSSVIAQEGIERIDLLKINVEKSEWDVVHGIGRADWQKIRQLVIEVDEQQNVKPITSLLQERGYEVLVEQDERLRNTELCYVYAIRPIAGKVSLARQGATKARVRPLPPVDPCVLAPAAIRTYLSKRLPQYMIPATFVLMEKLPLTANGKIDRQGFPVPSSQPNQLAREFVPPRTEGEIKLARIWGELLKLENIGAQDDFFELGGDSLLSIRAASRISEEFGTRVASHAIFDNPTIESLAIFLAAGSHSEARHPGPRSTQNTKFEIRRIEEDLIPALREFNARLDAGGAPSQFRFPEAANSDWLPALASRKIYEEHFAVVENGHVRGCYKLKHQPFYVDGEVRSTDFCRWPISEGLVNKKYAWVYAEILDAVLKREPLQYGLAMGDPVPEIVASRGWSLCFVPLYFRVNHPREFFREIRALQPTPGRRVMMQIVAEARFPGVGLKMVQTLRSRKTSFDCIEPIQTFGSWADDVWEQCREHYKMIAVRDSEALNILYPNPSRYLRFKVMRDGITLGWVVLLNTQMRNTKYFGNQRVGSIVDCLAFPGEESAVIQAATEILQDEGADLIVSNQSHSHWTRALRYSGYLKGPSNFNFGVSPQLSTLLGPLEAALPLVHMTRGDGDGPLHL